MSSERYPEQISVWKNGLITCDIFLFLWFGIFFFPGSVCLTKWWWPGSLQWLRLKECQWRRIFAALRKTVITLDLIAKLQTKIYGCASSDTFLKNNFDISMHNHFKNLLTAWGVICNMLYLMDSICSFSNTCQNLFYELPFCFTHFSGKLIIKSQCCEWDNQINAKRCCAI